MSGKVNNLQSLQDEIVSKYCTEVKGLGRYEVLYDTFSVLLEDQDAYRVQSLMEAAGLSSAQDFSIEVARKAFTQVPFNVFTFDVKTKELIYCNDVFAKLYGYQTTDGCVKNFTSSHGQFHNFKYKDKKTEALMDGNGVKTYEMAIRDENNEIRWFRAASVIDKSRQYLSTISIEVTTQKRAEEKVTAIIDNLQTSEKKLRNFFEQAQVGFFRSNFKTGRLLDSNLKFAEIMGYASVEEMMLTEEFSRSFNNLKFIETWAHLRKVVRERGKVSNYEAVAIKNDGSHVYINVSCILHSDTNILEGTIFDITEKKQTLRALFQTELRYKNISEQTNGVCSQYVCSPGGDFELTFLGGKVEEYFDVDLHHAYLNPKLCFKAIHKSDRAKLRRFIFTLEKDVSPWSLKVRVINSKFEMKWLQVSATPSRYLDGDVIWSLVAVDITEQERLANEKHQLESQLRQSQKMEALGTLAGGIAHDFNNILQGITFAVESSMMDKSMSAKSYDRLEKAQKFLLRGSDLVKQILTYCRRGDQELHPIYLEKQVNEVINLMKSGLPRTVVLKKDIVAHNTLVKGNAVQIQQVIMNLCSNAGYAMKENGGVIHLNLQEVYIGPRKATKHNLAPGTFLRLVVKDNGPGIPKNLQGRVFEPFFTTKPVGEGTGMGLAVVSGIIEAHGGFIEMSSSSNGTTFNLFIPVLAEDINVASQFDKTF